MYKMFLYKVWWSDELRFCSVSEEAEVTDPELTSVSYDLLGISQQELESVPEERDD